MSSVTDKRLLDGQINLILGPVDANGNCILRESLVAWSVSPPVRRMNRANSLFHDLSLLATIVFVMFFGTQPIAFL